MSAAIVVSSSPARTFAQSQTPVELSSPPLSCSPATCKRRRQEHRKSRTTRDGFSSSFNTAKQVLGTRSSAENVPVGSASPQKFKRLPSSSPVKFRPPTPYSANEDLQAQKQISKPAADWDAVPLPDCAVVRILPSDVRRKKIVETTGSLQLKKAAARRKDWTPTKPTQNQAQTDAGFGINLKKTFAHSQGNTEWERIAYAGDGALTKRRKIDLTSTGNEAPVLKPRPATKTTKPRSKSPAKKGLTITGLATSHYFGEEKEQQQATLMKQFFASTQARRDEDQDPDTFETKVKKKAPAKKKPRSRLKSPESALRALESQEVIFATASQCARDESPTLIRDTNAALKQSMEQLPSSPVRTQQSAIYSVESTTPQKTRISRFRSRKSLWTAADRDENDALLHMDDPFETPEVRHAFAGKDALFENAAAIPNLDEPGDSLDLLAALNPENVPTLLSKETTIFDIDDVITPNVTLPKSATEQARAYSPFARSLSPSKRTQEWDKLPSIANDLGVAVESASLAKRVPDKPNYALWTDEQLKERVKEYGFKRIRARKTMVDKLDEVWAEQNGLDPDKVKAATKAASQQKKVLQGGDILGTVHGLAARPTPKIKNPRARKKEEDSNDDKPKQKKKGKSIEKEEASELGGDMVFDIHDLHNSITFDRLAQMTAFADDVLQSFEPSTAPVKGTGVKATMKKKQKPLTPPPTVPPKPTQQSSPGFESPCRRRSASPVATLADSISSSQIEEVLIKSLIYKAIKHPPADDATRNHQTDPTWHEKMFLYDPIVLEDLTVWLNTEGFNAIGEDREIGIMEVKDWCHENGVCCLWRGGWRGNKKKAKGEE